MVEGGPIDVLTGDWLAELTMYILHKTEPAAAGMPGRSWRNSKRFFPPASSGGSPSSPMPAGCTPKGLATAVHELARRQGVTSASPRCRATT